LEIAFILSERLWMESWNKILNYNKTLNTKSYLLKNHPIIQN
jgi:hypothetical protein